MEQQVINGRRTVILVLERLKLFRKIQNLFSVGKTGKRYREIEKKSTVDNGPRIIYRRLQYTLKYHGSFQIHELVLDTSDDNLVII